MHATARVWNKAPFIRLLLPLIAGILLQWNIALPLRILFYVFCLNLSLNFLYFLLSLKTKFKLRFLHGIVINLMMLVTGMILISVHDIRNDREWFGHDYKEKNYVIVKLEEPLSEKTNSFKALASVQCLYDEKSCTNAKGYIIIYFKKDSALSKLNYGSLIIFRKTLQEIRNAGNPGAFDYRQYCLFQGISHQVYLVPGEFIVLPKRSTTFLKQFIFHCRDWVLKKLRRFIKAGKEQGLAEALLIGYKDDLDKNLVQSYSNTGVVHVIAISGLHLGLIYSLLLMLTKPLTKNKKPGWMRLIAIIAGIWWFSILAGAQPSVLRSAVMFSFLAAAEVLARRTSIYNTLALSAFVLLCYDPFWLWDIGFQLSYAAVLSIIIFFRHVYNWFYFKNKLFDLVWKLNAVTIAAQLLTLPLSIYHFHQIPTLFLFTNLVAVPLSSIILIGEICLCTLFFIPPLANLCGSLLQWMIWLMNTYIERWEALHFSLWDGLSITLFQTVLLTGFIIACCWWLMENRKILLWLSLVCMLGFVSIDSLSAMASNKQKKLIVYNVPKHQAIDLIAGRQYVFRGDSVVMDDDLLSNFYMQPSRILLLLTQKQGNAVPDNFIFCKKRILIVGSASILKLVSPKQNIDLLILSGSPDLYISHLNNALCIKLIVIDSSVPFRKAKRWKHDCDSLHIPCYNVVENGAFVMNL